MKKLLVIDPDTLETSVQAQFEQQGSGVKVTLTDPKGPWQGQFDALPGADGEPITPSDGQAYWDALDEVAGTYYRVTDDDEPEDAAARDDDDLDDE